MTHFQYVPNLCWRIISSGGDPCFSVMVVVRSEYIIPNGSSLATKCPRAYTKRTFHANISVQIYNIFKYLELTAFMINFLTSEIRYLIQITVRLEGKKTDLITSDDGLHCQMVFNDLIIDIGSTATTSDSRQQGFKGHFILAELTQRWGCLITLPSLD